MNAFKIIRHLIDRIPQVINKLRSAEADSIECLDSLVTEVQTVTQAHPDACLATIHLIKDRSPLKQPIFAAVLSDLLAGKLGYTPERTLTLLRAVITSNISLIDYQVLLNSGEKTLSDFQLETIRKHPLESVRILKAAGVKDQDWLYMIAQHHEQLDGNGYPHQLKNDAVWEEAQIISLTEQYTAMIDTRAYRPDRLPKQVLQDMYQQKHLRSIKLMTQFVQMMGIYPPGTFVTLANQEIGIVFRRIAKDIVPEVKALVDPQGNPYLGAIERDCHLPTYKITGACAKPIISRVEMELLWG
jgi:response regulator RpfG family c-di-GMP phosphodiesterase